MIVIESNEIILRNTIGLLVNFLDIIHFIVRVDVGRSDSPREVRCGILWEDSFDVELCLATLTAVHLLELWVFADNLLLDVVFGLLLADLCPWRVVVRLVVIVVPLVDGERQVLVVLAHRLAPVVFPSEDAAARSQRLPGLLFLLDFPFLSHMRHQLVLSVDFFLLQTLLCRELATHLLGVAVHGFLVVVSPK